MYNLLLILLTLKGKHVDRDLTYQGLLGFDAMNTKSSASSSSPLRRGGAAIGVVLLVFFYHSDLIVSPDRRRLGKTAPGKKKKVHYFIKRHLTGKQKKWLLQPPKMVAHTIPPKQED